MSEARVHPGSWLTVYRIHNSGTHEVGANDDEARIDTGVDIDDLQAPVGSGESLLFEAELDTTGGTELQLALIVKTPPHPNGGFQIIGNSIRGTFKGGNFGADSFNAPVGIVRSQQPGQLLGMGTLRVRGILANGEQPGLLKFQFGEAEEPGYIYGSGNNTSTDAGRIYLLVDGAWEIQGFTPTAYEPQHLVASGLDVYFAATQIDGGIDFDMYYSADGGVTATRRPIGGTLYIQYMALGSDGRVWALVKDEGFPPGHRFIYMTDDNGATWSEVFDFNDVMTGQDDANDAVLGIITHPEDPDKVAAFYGDGADVAAGAFRVLETDDGFATSSNYLISGTLYSRPSSCTAAWLRNDRIVVVYIGPVGPPVGTAFHTFTNSFAPFADGTATEQDHTGDAIVAHGFATGDQFLVAAEDDTIFGFFYRDPGAVGALPFWFRSTNLGDTIEIITADSTITYSVHLVQGMVFDESTGTLYAQAADNGSEYLTYIFEGAVTLPAADWETAPFIGGLEYSSGRPLYRDLAAG